MQILSEKEDSHRTRIPTGIVLVRKITLFCDFFFLTVYWCEQALRERMRKHEDDCWREKNRDNGWDRCADALMHLSSALLCNTSDCCQTEELTVANTN